MLEAEGITIKEPTAKSPNMNAFADRWAQTVQVECLDHFVVLGEDHLRYLVSEYVDYFNTESSPCAKPQVLVKGQPGVRLELAVTFQGGRRHLPVVTLRRVA